MNIKYFKKAIYSFVVFGLFTNIAVAGEVVEVVTKKLNEPNAKEEIMQFLFSDGFMKMKDAEDTEVVFSSADQNMMVISHPEKSYMIMDKDTGSNIKSEMDKVMEQALAEVPPEQRAMVERMMKQRMGDMGNMGAMGSPQMPQVEQPETEIRETGRSETINGYDCTFFETYRDSEKEEEYCVASWSELGVSDNIRQSFQSMGEFIEGLMEQFSQMAPIQTDGNPFAYMNEIDGFPVYGRSFENGEAVQETTLTSITEQDIDNNIFNAPNGYTEQGIMGQ